MYDLGILGGMGSFATEDLYRRVLDNTEAASDQEYPDIVVLNKASIPDRSSYLLGNSRENPLDSLLDGIRDLNMLDVGRIIIPCNTAHAFYEEMQKESEAPILNMVQSTLKYISVKNPGASVCILGTLGTIRVGVYERYNQFGLKLFYPDENVCEQIHELIYDIKANAQEDREAFSKRLKNIMKQTAGSEKDVVFVAACTELSVLNPSSFSEYDVVDALELIAELSVLAMGKPLKPDRALDQNVLKQILPTMSSYDKFPSDL